MRILFLAHDNFYKVKGGDYHQAIETSKALISLGHEVDIKISTEVNLKDLNNWDIVHLFNAQYMRFSFIDDLISLKNKNKTPPIAISTIYWDNYEEIWASRCIFSYYQQNPNEEQKAAFYRSLALRTIEVGSKDNMLSYSRYLKPIHEMFEVSKKAFGLADICLPNSYIEAQNMQHSLMMANAPFKVVNNAVNSNIFDHANPDLFREKYGDEPFVLSACRWDSRKNLVMIAEAVKKLGYKWVLIGPRPVELVESVVKRNLLNDAVVIDRLPQEELASAYAAAKVHINASFAETPSLASMEAALVGYCNIVAGNRAAEIEYFKEHVYYCDPLNLDSITEAIRLAYTNYDKDQARRDKLKQLITTEYTWENAAKQTLEAYEMVKR